MFCGSKKIHYSAQPYPGEDIEDLTTAFTNIKSHKTSQFNQKISFDSQGYPNTSETKNPAVSFTIDYNQILKQITIQSFKQQTEFWYSIQDHIAITNGDAIRVGKALLKVHEIYPINEQNKKHQIEHTTEQKSQNHCRICFSNEQSKNNPLLSVCKCSGSVKAMHLQCYRDWYHTKVKYFKERKITYFQLKNIRCQLCKTRIPFSITHNNIQYTFLNYKGNIEEQIAGMEMLMPDEDELYRQFQEFSEQSFDLSHYNMSQQSVIQSDNSRISLADGVEQIIDIGSSQNTNEQGRYIVLKSDKINEDDEQIIEVILIKLMPEYLITFGNENGASNIIIKNGDISPMHMSLNFINDTVFLFNYSKQLGTFIRMKHNIGFEFIGKIGAIIDNQNKNLMKFVEKPWILPCFQPEVKFKISLLHSFKQRLK